MRLLCRHGRAGRVLVPPDYRAFVRGLRKLCEQHSVRIRAENEGPVLIGPDDAKTIGEFPYTMLLGSPDNVTLGAEDEHPISNGRG